MDSLDPSMLQPGPNQPQSGAAPLQGLQDQGPPGASGGPDGAPGQGGPQPGAPPPQLPPMPERPNTVTIDQVVQLMRDDRMRSFRLDIETDSTVQADENEYKQRMSEFITSVGTYVDKVLPVAESHPELGSFLGETLLTVVRAFRVGRQLEGALEDAVAEMEAKAEQGGGRPPNPEMVKAQQDKALKEQEIASNERIEQQRLQAEKDRHAEELNFKREVEQTKLDHTERELAMKEGEQSQRHQIERDTIPADASGPVQAILAQVAQQLQGLAMGLQQAQAQFSQSTQDIHTHIGALGDEISAPKQIVYGEDGRPAGVAGPRGVRPIARDEAGRTVGLA
jgi:uncharacterized membrane protein